MYSVATASTAASSIAAIRESEPDLVILSVEFPDLDGTRLIAQVRAVSSAAIIALFSSGGAWSAGRLLDAGVDDCVEEPFLVQEVAARARRVLLRAGVWVHPRSVPTALGVVEIDPLVRTVRMGGQPLELTGREFDLLLVLLSAGGSPVSHEDLLRRIWGKGCPNARQNLRRVVSSLRSRIQVDPDHPGLLVNVRGQGYRLAVLGKAEATRPAE